MNDVQVTVREDEDGNQISSFHWSDDYVTDNRTWWQKVCDWWNNSKVTPYVKISDLNNKQDIDEENKPKPGAEIGIKIKF